MSVQGNFIPKQQLLGQAAGPKADAEFKSKYPNSLLSNKDLLRRKVSSQGGKQYFDSGDYVMKKKVLGMPPQGPSLFGLGTEVATVDKIPIRKTSQKTPVSITSPKKSSNLVSTPALTTTTHSEPQRDISPMATNPPVNPLTRHHMPTHMQFQEQAQHDTVTMKTPTSPATSPLASPPLLITTEADTDDMV